MAQTRRKIIVSTMKNEGPYILEWVAYHRAIGFDDFIIFSNDCSDGSNLILNRLDQMGVIRHFDNPLGPRMDPQRAAYSRANAMDYVREQDWVMILDADEFLNVHVGDRTVDALIEACPEKSDAISVCWRLMGSCGQAHMGSEPVTERFTKGSTFDEPENGMVWGFKTLFRPQKFGFFGVHRPKFMKNVEITPDMAHWVNGSGEDMGERVLHKGWRFGKGTLGYKFAQVNHYAIKSREEFLLKRLRGTANSKNKGRIDMGYWDKYDINANEDASIRSELVRPGVEELLRDGDLAALYRASLETCRRAIDYQMQDEKLRVFVETGVYEEAKE
ncbi:glycosyltransferase family 2 protein [Alphaproteobacteria bacterium KMM 3653]|uniref:Glycosyltransferase family 2 protein n=2 Tax=Harenicola maris TaxID=2841044 RepID=A0AAP2CP59_9RHOB|nr:glycosyltransferase family 2 protein [Harenicola maris]